VGLSTFLLARALPLRIPAALGAGVSCGLAASFHEQQLTPNLLEASAWLPLGALASLQLARGRPWPWAAALAIGTAASALAGYPQATVYCLYAWGWVFVTQLMASGRPAGGCLTALFWFSASVGLGALLAAVQLLPAVELSREGIRGLGTISFQQMFPFGSSSPRALSRAAQLVGPVGFALALLALTNRRLRGVSATFAILAVTTFLVTLGPATPVFAVYERLPLVAAFRLPSRILFVSGFALSILVGVGIETAAGLGGKASALVGAKGAQRTLVGLALAAALALGSTLALRLASGGEPLRGGISLAVLVCAMLATAWAARRRLTGVSALAVVLSLAVVADVLIAPVRPFDLPYTTEGYSQRFHRPPAILKRLSGVPDRTWIRDRDAAPVVPVNLASVFRIRSIDGYEPFSLTRQRNYFTYLVDGQLADETTARPQPHSGRPRRPNWAVFTGTLFSLQREADLMNLAPRERLLDLMAMRYFLTPSAAIRSPAARASLGHLGLRAVRSNARRDRGIELFENPRSVPRAFVTYNSAPAPPEERLLELLSRPDFDPLRRSFVEKQGEASDVESDLPGHPARLLRDEEHVVEVEAEAKGDGLLVLADTFYPGWTARVDGKPVPIHRVNSLFRGVYLPAGPHRVQFEFEPGSFRLGAALSLLGWIALGATAGRRARKPAD